MKKMLSLLFAALFLTGAFLCAASAEQFDLPNVHVVTGQEEEADIARASCSHSYRVLTDNPVSSGYYSLGSSMHEYRTYYQAICDKCLKKTTVFISGGPELHQIVSDGDHHISGKTLHAYYTKCTLCSFRDQVTIPCNCSDDGPSINTWERPDNKMHCFRHSCPFLE